MFPIDYKNGWLWAEVCLIFKTNMWQWLDVISDQTSKNKTIFWIILQVTSKTWQCQSEPHIFVDILKFDCQKFEQKSENKTCFKLATKDLQRNMKKIWNMSLFMLLLWYLHYLTLLHLSVFLFGKQDWVKTEFQTEVRSLSTSQRRTDLSTPVKGLMQNINSVTYISLYGSLCLVFSFNLFKS